MKSFFTLVMTFLFLQGNIGLALVRHYCGDMLAFQSVGLTADRPTCGMEDEPRDEDCPDASQKSASQKKNHCCHDELKQLQVDHSVKSPSLASVAFIPFVLLVISFVFGRSVLRNLTREVAPSGYSPPHRFSHLRFRAFLQIFRN